MALRKKQKRKGVALVLTLLVLSLLVVIMAEFSFSTGVDLRIARNHAEKLQHTYAVKGAVEIAKTLLQEDYDENATDSFDDNWAKDFARMVLGDLNMEFRIVDESRKFNPNTLTDKDGKPNPQAKEDLERLIQSFNLSPEPTLTKLSSSVHRRAKKDSSHPEGPLTSVDIFEILQPASDEDLSRVFALCECLTTWSDGRININTAPLQVLQSLAPEFEGWVAQEVLAYRSGNPFENPNELRKVSGINGEVFQKVQGKITTRSEFFTLICKTYYNGVSKTSQVLLYREKEKVYAISHREFVPVSEEQDTYR